MAIRMTLGVGHILEIAGENDHLLTLIQAEIRRRGGIPPGEEAYDEVAFPIFAALEDHIKEAFGGTIKGEDLRSPQMKEIIHTWIEGNLDEVRAWR